jgi:hypothetical protein
MNLKLIILLGFNVLISNIAFSQKEIVNYKQQDMDAYKIDVGIYNFWFHENNWNKQRFMPKGDTLPYFVDETNYKGILNYGIDYAMVDKTEIVFTENCDIYYLEIILKNFVFNTKDSVVNIHGEVKKGWYGKDNIYWLNKGKIVNNNVNIYIGKKKDTISKLYYVPDLMNDQPEEHIITYNGLKIEEKQLVIDSFPSFYMKNYEHFKTKNGTSRLFRITSKITPNSILTFGLTTCYGEIFEIGKLVFDTEDERRKKVNTFKRREKKQIKKPFKIIIRNNIQELYKDTISKQQLPWYYEVVSNAENYIVENQYAKAKNEYNKILEQDHYVFARDLHNAVRVSILARDYGKAIVWCEKLALKGVPFDYFNAQIFKRLKKTKQWNSFLVSYPKLNENYKNGLNLLLKNKLSELVTIDQKDYKRQAKGEFDREDLNATTQHIDGELIELIKREGFPSEEKIGIKMYQDTLISTANDYYVLVNHSHQVNSNRNSEIKKILNKSAKNFEYDNVRNILSAFVNLETCFMLYKGNLYSENNCIVNKKDLQKMKFIFRDTYGFILDQSNLSELAFSKKNEKEDETFMKDNFNFIEKVEDKYIVED